MLEATLSCNEVTMLKLAPEHYALLKPMLKPVDFNCYFAQSVLEQHVAGQVYVDQFPNPKAAYIRHSYGMSLLLGTAAEAFPPQVEQWLQAYILGQSGPIQRGSPDEWMQVFPWNPQVQTLLEEPDLQGYLESHSRINFVFQRHKYQDFQGRVFPKVFWDRYADFARQGIGYAVLEGGEPAAIAFSAFVVDHALEIGIETVAQHRKKGHALQACFRLIDHCLEQHLEPVWSCRSGNSASYHLALRLGFEAKAQYPYFRLNRHASRPTQA